MPREHTESSHVKRMDRKSRLLILAVWLAPILVSIEMDRWWVTGLAGVISLVMGIFLLIYPKTRNARWEAIIMVLVGVMSQGFAIIEFGFRGLPR
jgi:membrane protein YdbS with pleckstrin-like domain